MSRREGTRLSRRRFLQGSAALVIAFHLPGRQAVAQTGGSVTPNAFLTIYDDGRIVVTIDSTEMGQGVNTALPQILADELEADWSRVEVGPLPTNPAAWFRTMGTGGSRAVRTSRELLQAAGATGRELMRAAAAQRWGVSPDSCTCSNSRVVHADGRSADYGELVAIAATLPVPQEVPIKQPGQHKLIGQPLPRNDSLIKSTGRTAYGIDVQLPGMLYASVERAPRFGASVASFDAAEALAHPGVVDVIHLPKLGWDQQEGVAVIADRYWRAQAARSKLRIEWDESSGTHKSDAQIDAELDRARGEEGVVGRADGDIESAMATAARTVKASYHMPYVAHATMEPMNCTAHMHDGVCEIWAPTQVQTASQQAAAKTLGIPVENVVLHTTMLGGGFGRRLRSDYVMDAAYVASKIDAPVKLLWSREDDIRHSSYRPINIMDLEGGLDSNGNLVALRSKIVGDSPFVTYERVKGGEYDPHHFYGFEDIPYAIPNTHMSEVWLHSDVPANFWRSVSFSYLLFYRESFIDELAHAAGRDPVEFRRALLDPASRERGVLDLAVEKAGWGEPLPAGRGRGVSVGFVFESFCAMVVDAEVVNGEIRVHRVDAAVDCGPPVNPNIIEQQISGGIIWALSAALYQQINIDAGSVRQSNFHDYPILRMPETPEIHVHILDAGHPTGGIGEVGVPPLGPALGNALFAATGKRLREMPFQLS